MDQGQAAGFRLCGACCHSLHGCIRTVRKDESNGEALCACEWGQWPCCQPVPPKCGPCARPAGKAMDGRGHPQGASPSGVSPVPLHPSCGGLAPEDCCVPSLCGNMQRNRFYKCKFDALGATEVTVLSTCPAHSLGGPPTPQLLSAPGPSFPPRTKGHIESARK